MARCIVGLADSERFADIHLAAACFAAALADLAEDCGILAVAADSDALLAVAGPIPVVALLVVAKFLDS